MPCEVVLLMVDFFKMAAIAMETAKMLKNRADKNVWKNNNSEKETEYQHVTR
jgi:hypothetical protein